MVLELDIDEKVEKKFEKSIKFIKQLQRLDKFTIQKVETYRPLELKRGLPLYIVGLGINHATNTKMRIGIIWRKERMSDCGIPKYFVEDDIVDLILVCFNDEEVAVFDWNERKAEYVKKYAKEVIDIPSRGEKFYTVDDDVVLAKRYKLELYTPEFE